MRIEIKEVIKTYGNKPVLQFNTESQPFVFETGKIHGIIGPNGSGKTTLMKIIAGLTKLTKGNILYDGTTLNQQILTEMTFSNHTPVLFSRSVYENIAYPLKIRKFEKKRIHEIVSQLIREFELSEIQNQNAKHLSGGESQKTALARALSFSPKLLLLDEPTANIDPKSIMLIESALKKRNHEEGLTIIIITHNLSQAFRLCSHLTFLDQGVCLFTGTPDEIRATSNSAIQDFISFNRF
jgi:tungstate transport system ATP-binding protein